MFKFSAKFVMTLGTLQSEGVSGIDGEHMMSIVRDSSIHPIIVSVDSTMCNSESYKGRQQLSIKQVRILTVTSRHRIFVLIN